MFSPAVSGSFAQCAAQASSTYLRKEATNTQRVSDVNESNKNSSISLAVSTQQLLERLEARIIIK